MASPSSRRTPGSDDAPPLPTSYDEIPYESYPYPQTHPDRLAAIAALFGMRPAPVDRCSVLELGCAAGGNVIPMAVQLPESRFVGVDLSGRQVEEGMETVGALAMPNVELRHMSITDVDASFGRFDYVICHGVYSWVPAEVRRRILDICSEVLTEHGVAYVSYNTYPGWHFRGMVRDMMQYHASRFADPATRIAQARALLDFLASSVSRKDGPYGVLLKEEVDLLRDKRDSYLFHEHLEESNDPVYFHRFAEQATASGLQYLGEAQLSAMAARTFPQEVRETLRRVSGDIIQAEQYMDFLRNRMFRQTLLCRGDLILDRTLRAARLEVLSVESPVRPVAESVDLAPDVGVEFRGPSQVSVTTRDPIAKAALLTLGEAWPRWMPVADVAARALDRLGGDPPDARGQHAVAAKLLDLYASAAGLVELHTFPPPFTTAVSERPKASPLARHQSSSGRVVTTLRHERAVLSEAERHLLPHVDGARTRRGLESVMAGLVGDGTLVAHRDGEVIEEAGEREGVARRAVPAILERLARTALLRA